MVTGWPQSPGGFPVTSTRSFYCYCVGLILSSANCSLLEPQCECLSQSSLCSCSSKSANEISEDTFLDVAPVLCVVQGFLAAIFVINVHITHLGSELQRRTPHISASLVPHDSQNLCRQKQSRQTACSADLKAIHLSMCAKYHPEPSYKSGLVPRGITFSKSAISSIYIPLNKKKRSYELVSTVCWQRPLRAQQFSLNVIAQEKALESWHPGQEDPAEEPGASASCTCQHCDIHQ